MLVLGIDPGVGRLGWALVKKEKNTETLLDCGCLETPTNSPLPSRLESIHLFLKTLISKNNPDAVAIEDLFFAKNAKTVMAVGAARGVVLLTCSLAKIETYNYTPLQIKSAISGFGQADKKQVEAMVVRLLKLKDIPKLDDTVDAIAAALTHLACFRNATIIP
jgi:crossover junction endodeoxyribonuclease RuvC